MKVKFYPSGEEYEIQENQSVLQLAWEHDVHIQSVCKGVPSCAECRVQIKEGEHNVIPPGAKELSLIGSAQFVDNSRLSCQLKCFGDIVVDLSEQIAKAKRSEKAKSTSSAVEGNLILDKSEEFLKAVSEPEPVNKKEKQGTKNRKWSKKQSGNYSDQAERAAERFMRNEEVKQARSLLKQGKHSNKPTTHNETKQTNSHSKRRDRLKYGRRS